MSKKDEIEKKINFFFQNELKIEKNPIYINENITEKTK